MTKTEAHDRRHRRRQQLAEEREVRRAEGEARWRRRASRQVVVIGKERRGDRVEVVIDFGGGVTLPFDTSREKVEDIRQKIAVAKVLVEHAAHGDDRPN